MHATIFFPRLVDDFFRPKNVNENRFFFYIPQSKILETLDEMLKKYYELKSQDEDVSTERIADIDESLEYHDATSSEINVSAENFNPPSSKKRKIEAEPKKTPGRINRNANKENRWSNLAEKFENSVEAPETISQLPVVDLGEDFTMEEISRLPQLEPGRVETTLKEIIEQNRGSNDMECKGNENFTLEAWSKGQIPTNLQVKFVSRFSKFPHIFKFFKFITFRFWMWKIVDVGDTIFQTQETLGRFGINW